MTENRSDSDAAHRENSGAICKLKRVCMPGMNIPHKSRFVAVLAALLLVSAAQAADPSAFISVGNSYRLTTVPGTDTPLPGNVAKVLAVREGWIKAQCFVAVQRDGKDALLQRDHPTWINLAHVISATELPPMDVVSPNTQ